MSEPKLIELIGPEPVTIEEARAHLEAGRYGDLDSEGNPQEPVDQVDDEMIAGYIAAARESCEDFLGLSLSERVLEIALDAFPTSQRGKVAGIQLPWGPVREIVELTYVGDPGTMDPAAYLLDDFSVPARVLPVTTWPAFTAGPNAVHVRYSVGYGDDSDAPALLPRAIRVAILVMLGHLYENRGDAPVELPPAVQALLRPKRVRLGMA